MASPASPPKTPNQRRCGWKRQRSQEQEAEEEGEAGDAGSLSTPVIKVEGKMTSNEAEDAASPSTPELQAAATAMPRHLVRFFRGAPEADVQCKQHHGFTYVRFLRHVSPSVSHYDEWVNGLGDCDPYATPMPLAGTTSAELQEVWNILGFYASLRAKDFTMAPQGLPALPAVGTYGPGAPVWFHHSCRALSEVLSRLQRPDANHPAIFALPAGTHFVNLQWTWGKGHIVVRAVVRA